MKVLKFGGTSVGSASRMKEVAKIILDGERKIIVLSAMSGTTNSLLEYASLLKKNEKKQALEQLSVLELRYITVVEDLYTKESFRAEGMEILKSNFNYLKSYSTSEFSIFEEKEVVAQGEFLSTKLFQLYLKELEANSVLISALDFVRIDENEEPDMHFIQTHLPRVIASYPEKDIFITQGFVCRNPSGFIDNLKRGGSDYTASLIGAVLKVDEIQIWTDIDGMHNNDPRFVEKTKPISFLHFDEAAELAYFGAKILHPTCILPAKKEGVAVRLLNTMAPDAPGTLISARSNKSEIKAVAAKDGITAIKIKSGRMLLAYGFLRRIFEIFESYHTPIDMVTTSEVGVSLSIDNPARLKEILCDLEKYGDVTVDAEMTIICVVGDLAFDNVGFPSKVVQAMREIPIRMISYGGSNYNVSFMIPQSYKEQALNALSTHLFL